MNSAYLLVTQTLPLATYLLTAFNSQNPNPSSISMLRTGKHLSAEVDVHPAPHAFYGALPEVVLLVGAEVVLSASFMASPCQSVASGQTHEQSPGTVSRDPNLLAPRHLLFLLPELAPVLL